MGVRVKPRRKERRIARASSAHAEWRVSPLQAIRADGGRGFERQLPEAAGPSTQLSSGSRA